MRTPRRVLLVLPALALVVPSAPASAQEAADRAAYRAYADSMERTTP